MSFWTLERIAILKKLWSQGLSGGQIADHLGGISRNAVLGKAHRLGLDPRPDPMNGGRPKKRKPVVPVSMQIAEEGYCCYVVSGIDNICGQATESPRSSYCKEHRKLIYNGSASLKAAEFRRYMRGD